MSAENRIFGWGRATLVATLAVLAGTLAPFDFRLSSQSLWEVLSIGVGPDLSPDVIGNVLLFWPIGFSLSGYLVLRRLAPSRIVGAVVALSLCLSYTIETLQLFLPSRVASLSDVLSNGAGAGLGFLAHALWRQQRGWVVVASYMTVALLVAAPIQWTTTLNFWDDELPLLVGNERTGDRPWRGTVFDVALLDESISDDVVRELQDRRHAFTSTIASVVASYDLARPCPCSDELGNLPPLVENGQPGLGSHLPAGRWFRTNESASELVRRVKKTSSFTLVVTAASASPHQTGPARIVSLSSDPGYRNFTLGQDGDDLVFRLRLPLTGTNGDRPALVVPDVFDVGVTRHVVVTYDGIDLVVYVDGVRSPHAIRFGIGAAALSPLLGRDVRLFHLYDGLFYALVFAPFGVLMAIHGALIVGSGRWLATAAALAAYSLVFEVALMMMSGRVFSRSNLLWSLVFAAAGVAIHELARARAAGAVVETGVTHRVPAQYRERGSA